MHKILWVVYWPDISKIEVTVEDCDGKRRRIDYRWHTKDKTPPPGDWFKYVEMEIELQRSIEHDKKIGRFSY